MKEYSILFYIKRIIFSMLILGIAIPTTYAQMQLEKLDRGVVAVSMGGTKVFVSWRWLGTEDDITFNLYRNGTKVNATPLTVSNYTDNAGSTTATYTVTAIVGGVEQPASAGVKPWAQQYLKVPIQAPPAGTTPTGEAYTYNANDASIADLDGDGQWEIILKWDPSNSKDNSQSGYTGNTYIDAYEFDGTRMWRIDFGRNIRSGAHYLDFMVYDFDGDGQAEMMARTAEATKDGTGVVIGNANADYRNSGGYVLSGPEYITVFNGKTGKAMATNNLYPPRGTVSDWGDSYGNRVDRFKACVAYLDGQRPSAVFTRGYYAKWGAEAIDWRNGKLTQRWTFMVPNNSSDPNYSEGAHSLSVADVDGDGKQEVITGSLILDDNGTVYYNTNIGHGDALHVSDLDPDLAGIEIMHIQEPVADAGVYMYSGKSKKVLWKKPTVAGSSEGPGRGVCADISAKYRGAESWVAGGGIAGVFDCKGNLTTLGNPQSCNFLAWWDGDVLRELLNNTMIDKFETGRLLTAYQIAPIASNNGTKSTPSLSGDIMGDWREEVIWRAAANDALYIFTTTTPSTYKFRTLMQDPQYRVAIAWQNTGYNQPPHLSYYLGDGMATPSKPNIAVIPPANVISVCTATLTAPATSFCTGGSVVLTASTGASYKWFNGTTQVGTAATYTATAAGSYTVEVTNAAGCKATSAITQISVTALPTATITSPANSFCTGGSVLLTSSTGTSYKWFNGTTQVGTAATYTATAAGSYTVEVTNAAGCKATSAVKAITVSALPTATITSPANSFCTGGSVVLTSSTGTSYKWFNGTTQVGTAATYTATAAGAYTVEVTNAAGCKATSAVTQISVTALPTATITSPANVFCAGGSVVLTSSIGTTYKWFNGTTQVGTAATYTATDAGSYTVEITNAAGCKATSAVKTITVNPLPVITSYVKIDAGSWLTATTATACEGSTVNLGPQPNVAAGWNWTGPNNFTSTLRNPVLTNVTSALAGNYISTYTDANGCKASSTFALQVSKASASITASATSFCAGGSAVLTASTGDTYKWFNGTTQVGTAATYTATAAGSYTVEVTNSSGCKATSDATVITVGATQLTPTINATTNTICAGGSAVLTSSTGASYKWFNGTTQVGTAATYTASAAGSYSVEVTNSSGCKATSAPTVITVGSTQLTPTIVSTTNTICAGGSAVLTASTGASYKWFNGSAEVGTAATYTATAAGSYTVEVTNTSGCKATSDATVITQGTTQSTPTIATTTNTICPGGTAVLTASTGASYKWFNGTTQVGTAATYTVTDIGSYSVEVTNTSGCKATSSPVLISAASVQSTPTIVSTTNIICSGSSVLLTASTGASYKWFNGTTEVATTATYTATAAGSYTVEVTNTSGCKTTSAPTVITQTQPKIWYADTDGDGLGDPAVSLTVCWQPNGYVDVAGDLCPASADNNCLDCAGMANGTAYIDNCSVCVGGNTGKTACVSTATINGTSADILVTPQPFDNTTTISVKNLGMIQSITTVSTSGAIVDYRQGIAADEITLGQELAAGLYSVIIITDKGTYTTKIVKK